MNDITQRDAFWNTVYDLAREDRDVVLVSADMGAPSLDKFRRDLPAQFVNAGIAEQNAILVASGLALAGKKVYAYAIAPFITFRCLEQIRVNVAMMNVPVTIVGVGAGLGYEDSGPTHHLTEDLALMRVLPNMTIHSLSDSVMSAAVAKMTCGAASPQYVRLERQVFPVLYGKKSEFSSGVSVLKPGGELALVATGSAVHTALEIADRLKGKGTAARVVDVYRLPVNEPALLKALEGSSRVVTMEEHFLPGGFGSAVAEVLADNGKLLPLRRLGLPIEKGYCYRYGGRENLRKHYGFDKKSIEKEIAAFLKA